MVLGLFPKRKAGDDVAADDAADALARSPLLGHPAAGGGSSVAAEDNDGGVVLSRSWLCPWTTDWAVRTYYGPTLVTALLLVLSPVPLRWTTTSACRLWTLMILNGLLYHHLHDSDPGFLDPPPAKAGHRDGQRPTDAGENGSSADPGDEEQGISGGNRGTSDHHSLEVLVSSQLNSDRAGFAAQAAAQTPIAPTDRTATLAWERWPPMRAHYCRMKRRYVAKFDHSCDILQTAIGERNHALFFWWLLGSFLQFHEARGIAETRFSWSEHDDYGGGDGWSMGIIPAFLVVVFMDLLMLLSGVMVLVHGGLLITGSTTHEFIRRERVGYLADAGYEDFPFSQGVIGNLKLACWDQSGAAVAVRAAASTLYQAASWRRRSTSSPNEGLETVAPVEVGTAAWTPHLWERPAAIRRDSEDVWSNPCQNRYWSCF